MTRFAQIARLHTLPLISLLFIAAPAHSDIFSYTITGTLDGFSAADLSGNDEFFPDGPVPFEDNPTYTFTFDLEDSTPLSSNGATFAFFNGALSNPLLTVDNEDQDFVSADESDVLQTFNGPPGSGANQTWAALLSPFELNGMSTIPTFDVFGGEFEEFDTVEFTGLEAVVFDNTGNLFTMDPPELVTPQDGDYTNAFIELRFEGFTTSAFMGISGTIDSVTRVPEPGFGLMLMAGTLVLSSSVRSRKSAKASR